MGPHRPARRRRDDDPQAAVDALLDEAKRRADAFAAAYAGKVAELDGPGLIAAMHELGEIEEIAGRAGTYAHLSFSVDTADPAHRRAAAARRGEGHRDRDRAAVLPARVGGARRRARRASCSPPTGLDFARHHLATARRYRPHLLSEPEEQILTEKALSGRTAWVRLFEEQTAAIQRRAAGRDRAGLARGRAGAALLARPRGAPRHRRARDRGAGARPAHARLHVQHAARGQDDRRPAALASRTGWRRATCPTRPPTSPCRR